MRRLLSLMVLSWVNLSCLDRDIQTILLGWEGTGGVIGKGARQVVCLVEIHEKFLVLFIRIGVVIAARGVGGVAVGQVHELDEETVIGFFGDDQFMFLPIYFKSDISVNGLILDCTKDIRHLYNSHLLITGIGCRDVKLFLNGVPRTRWKGAALFACVI